MSTWNETYPEPRRGSFQLADNGDRKACMDAAVEIITALHAEGADFLLTDSELAAIIYRNVHERAAL